ncbi:MFS transporter [Streptomyces rimosus]|uniref:MFS transporter n=1 Tax=Streptomyces rimosus TaxID=1927 RepID=UPI00311D46FD
MSPSTGPRPTTRLLLLSLLVFIIGTIEFLPVGLLPDISRDLDVAPSRTGLLVTVYAFTVGLTAAPLTARTSAWPRKRLFLTACAVFMAATALSGLSPNYAALAATRLLCGLAHGVFYAIVAGYAAAIAGPGRSGRATAIVLAGVSLAFVVGVPLGTAAGTAFGWRTAFLATAALGLAALLTAARLLPRVPPGPPLRVSDLPRVARTSGLAPVVLTTGLVILGHFTLYTYVTEYLRDAAGIAPASVSAVLLLFGLTGIAGTLLSGALVDTRPRATLLGTLTLMAVSLTALGAAPSNRPLLFLAIATWGLACTALPVCFQTAVLRTAHDAPDAASSLYVAAFNTGIGAGALTGGLLLTASPPAALPWAALALLLAGTATTFLTRARSHPHHPATDTPPPTRTTSPSPTRPQRPRPVREPAETLGTRPDQPQPPPGLGRRPGHRGRAKDRQFRVPVPHADAQARPDPLHPHTGGPLRVPVRVGNQLRRQQLRPVNQPRLPVLFQHQPHHPPRDARSERIVGHLERVLPATGHAKPPLRMRS